MPTFATKRHVAYSADQMLALVADIERYPEFLPLCTGLIVSSRRETEAGLELIARMSVGYKSIAESFTTRVVVQRNAKRIDVSYLDGPFRHLDNRWHFIDAPSGSIIDFYISYEFRSALFGALVGSMFDKLFRRFAEVFEERARAVYGVSATAGA